MTKYQIADEKGQNKVIEQLDKIFSGHTHTYTQHVYDYGRIDIEMSFNDKNLTYFFEAKDRGYNHNAFGGEWLIEEHKLKELTNKENSFYINTFKDNWLCVWNLSNINIDEIKSEIRYLEKKHLEPEKGKEYRKVYFLNVKDCCYSQPFIT